MAHQRFRRHHQSKTVDGCHASAKVPIWCYLVTWGFCGFLLGMVFTWLIHYFFID
jgi:hypothetical protein